MPPQSIANPSTSSSSSPAPPPLPRNAFICFPGATYTQSCAVEAAKQILEPLGWKVHIRDEAADEETTVGWVSSHSPPPSQVLYLMDYDLIPFDSIHPARGSEGSASSLASSYPIRKALIRKNWLFNAVHAHSVKSASKAGVDVATQSPLRHLPQTWNIDVQFADDLDELLIDDLYDLAQQLEDSKDDRWYILKAGMADRGMGIRMFNSLDGLRGILEEFEADSSDEGEDDEDEDEDAANTHGDTSVSLSQLRHFVIQEYLQPPLLIAPNDTGNSPPLQSSFRKFHLRAYVLCVGGLSVFLCDEMLALFAPAAYQPPGTQIHDAQHAQSSTTQPDPRVHLTNTCLHADGSATADGRLASENVHLLSDLCKDGKPYKTHVNSKANATLTPAHCTRIKDLAAETIGETFEAAAKGSASTNWMMWDNAWEIFGVDLMVVCPGDGDDEFSPRVSLLEINAQPDFAQSGERLQGVIRTLFQRSLQIAVSGNVVEDNDWQVGASRDGMTLCFSERMRGGW